MTWRDNMRNLFKSDIKQAVAPSIDPMPTQPMNIREVPAPVENRHYGIIDVMARPNADQRLNEQIGQWPKWWVRYPEFDRFAQQSDIFQIITLARKREIFRRGIRIKDAEGTDITGPKPYKEEPLTIVEEDFKEKGKDLCESFIKQANANDQTLIEVLREIDKDECTYDDAYLACQYEYECDTDTGLISGKYAKEFFRLHPWNVKIMVDNKNRFGRDQKGNKIYFSVYARNQVITEDTAKRTNYKDAHGVQLFPAYYQFTSGGSDIVGSVYYAPWEVKHGSKFNPTLTYSSCPPLMTIWMKLWTLVKMDEYVMQYYALQRPPKFFLVFNTTNAISLEKEYDKMIQRASVNPHIPQILANESKEQAGSVQTVDLMRSLEEMQFTPVRDEFRKQIGAVFGVMPLWHADVSGSGGLNNESQQITLTDREMEDSQRFYNEKYLRFITRAIGVSDLVLELEPNKELDEVAEETRLSLKIANAKSMLDLGMDVHYDPDTGEFTYSGNPQKQASPFGAFPGAGQDQGAEGGAGSESLGSEEPKPGIPQPSDLIDSSGGTKLPKEPDFKKGE